MTLIKSTAISVLLIVLVTEAGILQEVFSMVSLSLEQWLICLGVAALLLVVEEVRKFFKVRAGHEMPEPTDATPAAAAPATA